MSKACVTADALRRELASLNSARAEQFQHEQSFGSGSSIVYSPTQTGEHGNFLNASYTRILANPSWRKRLDKAYTGSALIPRRWERKRGELECATSSDALLMNIFCFPRLLHGKALCALLGIDTGLRPEFGVRALIPMEGEIDRTELDMKVGSLLVEAKLTESSFGTASRQRVQRYVDFEEVFRSEELPWRNGKVEGYQLIRGVLAATATHTRYVLLCDARRADLQEIWFRVLQAVRSCAVRSNMALLTWQELACHTPKLMQDFLCKKYGIFASE